MSHRDREDTAAYTEGTEQEEEVGWWLCIHSQEAENEQNVRPSATHFFLQKGLTSQRYHSLHQRHAIWGPSVQRREPMGDVSRSSHKSRQPLQGCAPNGLTSSHRVPPPKNSLTIAPQAGRKALGGLLHSTQTSYFTSSVLSSAEKYK